MKIDAKAVVEKVRKERENKSRYTYTLTPSVKEEFHRKCESQEVSASEVLEEMIKLFNSTLPEPKEKK